MPFENPFFTREMRQTVHRPLPLLVGLLAVSGVLGGFILLRVHFRTPGHQAPDVAWTGLLLFLHTLSAVAAGSWGASRVFLDEHRRGTLEGLYLLPLSAHGWLFQRLLFPVYMILLAWCVPLPIYLIGALGKAVAPALLERFLWLPLVGGVGAALGTLLFPPDVQERMRKLQSGGSGRQRAQDADLRIRIQLGIALTLLVQFGVLALLLGGAPGMPFYVWGVPRWLPLAAVPLLLLPASGITAVATVSRQERLERAAYRTRLAVLGLLYYTDIGVVVGASWNTLPLWSCASLLLAGPVGVWIILRRAAPRQEDARSHCEVERLTRRWSNALLVKDLRVFARFTSLTRFAVRELLAVCVSLAGLYYLVVWSGRGSLDDFLFTATMFALVGSSAVLLAELCIRPFTSWTRERTGGTLPLLFLTPLSSRSILVGRLTSALVFAVSAHWPVLLIGLLALARLAIIAPWNTLVGVLIYLPVCALFWVAFGATARPQTEPPWRWRTEDWYEVVLGVAQIILFCGFGWVLTFGDQHPEMLPLATLLGFAVFSLNMVVVYHSFQIRVAQFDALRSGEWVLPDK